MTKALPALMNQVFQVDDLNFPLKMVSPLQGSVSCWIFARVPSWSPVGVWSAPYPQELLVLSYCLLFGGNHNGVRDEGVESLGGLAMGLQHLPCGGVHVIFSEDFPALP